MTPGQKVLLTAKGIVNLASIYPDAHRLRGTYLGKPERKDGKPPGPYIRVEVDGLPRGFHESFWEADDA